MASRRCCQSWRRTTLYAQTGRPAAANTTFMTRLLDPLRRRNRCRHAIGQRPSAVLFNPDGNRLVPRPVEVREDRRRRRQRHFMLARASAVEHADTKSLHVRRIQEAEVKKG